MGRSLRPLTATEAVAGPAWCRAQRPGAPAFPRFRAAAKKLRTAGSYRSGTLIRRLARAGVAV
jgi:hypothetical protein